MLCVANHNRASDERASQIDLNPGVYYPIHGRASARTAIMFLYKESPT